MGSQDPRSAVENLVRIVRRITRVTQIAPFAYLLLLAVYLLTESMLPVWVLHIGERLFSVPAYLLMFLLGLGRLLKLCMWYVVSCLLLLVPKAVMLVDSFVVTLWYEEMLAINICTGIGYMIFLLFAYRHFFAHGREKAAA